MLIDILCKVVDNLGDIGFVYRLARALSELPDPPRLRIIVTRLSEFAALCPGVDPDLSFQAVGTWQVINWDSPGEENLSHFIKDRPRLILECYACGRPGWLDKIIFDETDPIPRHIINLEYLTAENWASEYHRLPSLTRSPLVQKHFFMPGLKPGTGGLLQDQGFMEMVDDYAFYDKKITLRREALKSIQEHPSTENLGLLMPQKKYDNEKSFWFFLFSYEHDFSSIVSDLATFHLKQNVLAVVAAGRSSEPFLESWRALGSPFPVLALPTLKQPVWDKFVAASDFLVVRGEETFARACLTGRPFLWECYPFSEHSDDDRETNVHGGQLPKIQAFLDTLKPFLDPSDFLQYEKLTLRYNHIFQGKSDRSVEPSPGDLLTFLANCQNGEKREIPVKTAVFETFSLRAKEIRNLGNLALNLLTFLRNLG